MSVSPDFDITNWYLDEDAEMGESRLQRAIIDLLLRSLQELAVRRGWKDYILDSDQFIAWIESDQEVRVSPDVYLVWSPPKDQWVDSWQIWREDHNPPSFAIEVVSRDYRKDYFYAPEKYDDLGVDELIVFDPSHETRPKGRGLPFQLWRRDADGFLRRKPAGSDHAFSAIFDVYVVATETPDGVRLRLTEDLGSRVFIPTKEERLEAETAALAADKARLADEKARLEAETERLRSLLAGHGVEPD